MNLVSNFNCTGANFYPLITLYCTICSIIIIKQSVKVNGFSAKLFIALLKRPYTRQHCCQCCTEIEQSSIQGNMLPQKIKGK